MTGCCCCRYTGESEGENDENNIENDNIEAPNQNDKKEKEIEL